MLTVREAGMIVQTAPEGAPRFIITMAEHTSFAGQLARVFGNDRFEPVAPREEMFYLIDHHDQGWRELDAEAPMDPETRLPYHLVETPLEKIITTSEKSPSLNSERHPYCGLLSSMHTWGLYNGRYGLSDMVLLDSISDESRPLVQAMLDGELERQKRLKAQLVASPATAEWLEEPRLMQNYKQLQFFDTAALYFQMRHDEARGAARFDHVPLNAEEDVQVAVSREASGVYAFAPFPFGRVDVEVSFTGRYLAPLATDDRRDLATVLAALPESSQTVRLVSGN
jgi:hypothetical protein